MAVNKQENGKWLCQIDRKGLKRVRKTFDTKSDAETFQRTYLFGLPTTNIKIDDPRTLLEIIDIWYKYHGFTLSNADKFKRQLKVAATDLGNPIAHMLTPESFVQYRYDKTQNDENIITAKTFNNLHGSISAMFNKLIKLKVIDYENPIIDVDKLRIHEKQMSYLSRLEIDNLLETIKDKCENESTWYVVNLCLRTGARWGEAEGLTKKQLHNCSVTYVKTKSKKTRNIPLNKLFNKELLKFAKDKNPNDHVFTSCIGSYRKAVKRTSIELPRGQLSHVLRHSFSSHFMMNDGNILTLKEILGHSDIKMTMRYAHLAPSHLADAVLRNPLSK